MVSEVNYSAKFLSDNPQNICYFQGTQETEVDSLLTVSEGIHKEALDPYTQKGVKEVVSEDEDQNVSF